MIRLSLPFYGKRGSISQIIEQEKGYTVIKYGIDGKEEVALTVPKGKTKRNEKELLQNYYQDMKCYLDQNYDKYFEYKSTRLKKKMNIKNIYLGAGIAGCTFMLGIVLMTLSNVMVVTGAISYIGLVIAASSVSGLVASMNLRKEYKKDEEKGKFIEQFNSYSRELDTYYRMIHQISSHTPTKYEGLRKINTHENTLEKKKIKSLAA